MEEQTLNGRPAHGSAFHSHLTMQGVLFLGFALIFALWLLSGYDLLTRVTDVQTRTADVGDRYTDGEEALAAVRAQVLLASVYLRDSLLDDHPEMLSYYAEQLDQTRQAIDRAVARYVPVEDSGANRKYVATLVEQLDDFWLKVTGVLAWDNETRERYAQDVLRSEIIPGRQMIIGVTERIRELNRETFTEQQAILHVLYLRMQRRVWETGGLAILLSLAVAVLVTRHVSRLEGRIRRQQERDAQSTRDLQRLSTKLVNAQEEERRVIARELHDEVGQALTAIKVQLALLGRNRDGSEAAASATLDDARGIADHALQAVRDLSHLLHPSLLDNMGLPAALDWFLRGFERRTGIQTKLVHSRIDERLAAPIETCCYRIVQEACANVTRHARASNCRVYLRRTGDVIVLTVEDDGQGFDAGQRAGGAKGLGLLGIQERAVGFRGTFRIDSAPGKGTRLTVELPALPRGDAQQEPVIEAFGAEPVPAVGADAMVGAAGDVAVADGGAGGGTIGKAAYSAGR
jgi:signal transduction histidine kinase